MMKRMIDWFQHTKALKPALEGFCMGVLCGLAGYGTYHLIKAIFGS